MYLLTCIEIGCNARTARPRIGGSVVAGWPMGIILNLLLLGAFYDIALRDLGVVLDALAHTRRA